MVGLQSSDFVVGKDLDVLFDFCEDEWLNGDIEIQQQLLCIGEEVCIMYKSAIKGIQSFFTFFINMFIFPFFSFKQCQCQLGK